MPDKFQITTRYKNHGHFIEKIDAGEDNYDELVSKILYLISDGDVTSFSVRVLKRETS